MKPTSPVLPNNKEEKEVVYAKDQPQYLPLPAVVKGQEGRVITHWKLSWKERFRVLFYGSLWLQQLTFGSALQPQLPTVEEP